VAIHLVYPHAPRISTPDAIGFQLARRLTALDDVVLHEWDDLGAIRPRPGDVLLGHPHPSPWTVFRRSARRAGWRRVVAMFPYTHGDALQCAYADPVVRDVDAVLAITGRHWFRRIEEGPYRHWRPRMRHLDLAVDRVDFPRVKGAFAPPGRRRFLYVGHQAHYKNVPYLSAIARAAAGPRMSFVGSGPEIPGLERLGPRDFSTVEGRETVSGHDFLLTVGHADANPTTILEAMAWGLVPVCTRQSGYEDEPGVPNVPLGDLPGALAVIGRLQGAPAAELEALRAAHGRRLAERYHWDRFAADVTAVLGEEGRAPLLEEDPATERLLRRNARRDAVSPWKLRNLRRLVKTNLWRRMAGRGEERLPRAPPGGVTTTSEPPGR